jgi:hypothetical protein
MSKVKTPTPIQIAFLAYNEKTPHVRMKVSLASKGNIKFNTNRLIEDLKTLYSNDIIVSRKKTTNGYNIKENGVLIDVITYLKVVK